MKAATYTIALGILSITTVASKAQLYQLFDMSHLGYSQSSAEDINDAGLVAGSLVDGNGRLTGFLATPSGTHLLRGSNSTDSQARAVNSIGELAFNADGQVSVFSSAGTRRLGLFGSFTSIEAEDISESGQIAAKGYFQGSKPRAVVYENGKWLDINSIAGFSETSAATAINNAGQVAGSVGISAGETAKPFILENGIAKILPLPSGFSQGVPRAINNAGEIAGHMLAPSGDYHAFVSQGGAIVDLGIGQAYDMNDQGQVVGFNPDGAFIYDAHNGLRNLNNLLASTASFHLENGLGINNLGQIVGYGDSRAWVLSPEGIDLPIFGVGISRQAPDGGFIGFAGLLSLIALELARNRSTRKSLT